MQPEPHRPTESGLATADEAWRVRARCRDGAASLVPLFFSDDVDDIARARAFCRGCAVRTACLASAIARREPCGVWGGELFSGGRVLAVKRARGRPPAVPRPWLLSPVIDPAILAPPRTRRSA